MADIFLSYSREDHAVARRCAELLEREGFSVWWDQTLRSGEAYDEITEQALKGAKAVVVLWSRHSVASRWVRSEATIADRAGRLVPAMIEPCERPVMFELRQSADLTGWQGEAGDPRWHAFVRDVRAHVDAQGTALASGAASAQARSARGVSSVAAAPTDAQSKRTAAIAAIATVFIALSGGLFAMWRSHARKSPPAQPAAVAAPARTGDATLAVLPFIDISEKHDQETFADGLSEELLNSLARIRGLQVTGRTSSFYFKGKNEDMKVIGEKLGVEYLLEGSVRKSGDQLRITAQLVKAKDGFHLWSQTYDQPITNIFQIQEDLARSVANALQIRLGVGDLARIPGMTRDVEAYEAWMSAFSAVDVGISPSGLDQRLSRLQAAVRRDPDFFFAWFELSTTYTAAASATPRDAPGMLEKSREAAAEAARTAPTPELKELVKLNALLQFGNWLDAAAGVAALDRFQQQFGMPNIVSGPTSNGGFLVLVDKPSSGIELLERAYKRDPLNMGVAIYLAEAYADAGRLEQALVTQRRSLKENPRGVQAVAALLTARVKGNKVEEEQFWQNVRDSATDPKDLVARLHTLRHSPAQALEEIRKTASQSDGAVPHSRLATWAVYFGDDTLALELLRKGRDRQRTVPESLALWRPAMAGVRRLPGFKDVVREFGFVDYWRKHGWGEHCQPLGETDFECR